MSKKTKINKVIIVEGKHDKIKLDSIFEATVITTDGFRIYQDKEKMDTIRKLASEHGVIVFTDSDMAGFKIRNCISGILPKEKIHHIYLPQVAGKEKRKSKASKENMLGVEGFDKEIIFQCFKDQGFLDSPSEIKNESKRMITKMDFYEDGLIGKENSEEKRNYIKKFFNLPGYLSTKSLIEILNKISSYDEYKNIVSDIIV